MPDRIPPSPPAGGWLILRKRCYFGLADAEKPDVPVFCRYSFPLPGGGGEKTKTALCLQCFFGLLMLEKVIFTVYFGYS